MADETRVKEEVHGHVLVSEMQLGHKPSSPLNLPPAFSQFIPASYRGGRGEVYIYTHAQKDACIGNRSYISNGKMVSF